MFELVKKKCNKCGEQKAGCLFGANKNHCNDCRNKAGIEYRKKAFGTAIAKKDSNFNRKPW